LLGRLGGGAEHHEHGAAEKREGYLPYERPGRIWHKQSFHGSLSFFLARVRRFVLMAHSLPGNFPPAIRKKTWKSETGILRHLSRTFPSQQGYISNATKRDASKNRWSRRSHFFTYFRTLHFGVQFVLPNLRVPVRIYRER
jgi:hypothetical protein